MFEKLEESFELLNANLLTDEKVTESTLKEISSYINYCQARLEYLVDEINMLQENENKSQNLKLLEEVYEEKIIYLLHDISSEMFNLQTFLAPKSEGNEKILDILESIDGVEALLMLIPEEIEKVKCLIIAFLN